MKKRPRRVKAVALHLVDGGEGRSDGIHLELLTKDQKPTVRKDGHVAMIVPVDKDGIQWFGDAYNSRKK